MCFCNFFCCGKKAPEQTPLLDAQRQVRKVEVSSDCLFLISILKTTTSLNKDKIKGKFSDTCYLFPILRLAYYTVIYERTNEELLDGSFLSSLYDIFKKKLQLQPMTSKGDMMDSDYIIVPQEARKEVKVYIKVAAVKKMMSRLRKQISSSSVIAQVAPFPSQPGASSSS